MTVWRKFAVTMAVMLVVSVPVGFGSVALFGPDWGPMVATVTGVVLANLVMLALPDVEV